jgi:hypothetical protein
MQGGGNYLTLGSRELLSIYLLRAVLVLLGHAAFDEDLKFFF